MPDPESPLDQYALNLVAQEVFVVPLAGLLKALFSLHGGPELDVPPLFGGQRELVHKSVVFVEFVDVLLYPPYQSCLGRQLLSLRLQVALSLGENSLEDQELLLTLLHFSGQVELDVHFVDLLLFSFFIIKIPASIHLLVVVMVYTNIVRLLEGHRVVGLIVVNFDQLIFL